MQLSIRCLFYWIRKAKVQETMKRKLYDKSDAVRRSTDDATGVYGNWKYAHCVREREEENVSAFCKSDELLRCQTFFHSSIHPSVRPFVHLYNSPPFQPLLLYLLAFTFSCHGYYICFFCHSVFLEQLHVIFSNLSAIPARFRWHLAWWSGAILWELFQLYVTHPFTPWSILLAQDCTFIYQNLVTSQRMECVAGW